MDSSGKINLDLELYHLSKAIDGVHGAFYDVGYNSHATVHLEKALVKIRQAIKHIENGVKSANGTDLTVDKDHIKRDLSNTR